MPTVIANYRPDHGVVFSTHGRHSPVNALGAATEGPIGLTCAELLLAGLARDSLEALLRDPRLRNETVHSVRAVFVSAQVHDTGPLVSIDARFELLVDSPQLGAEAPALATVASRSPMCSAVMASKRFRVVVTAVGVPSDRGVHGGRTPPSQRAPLPSQDGSPRRDWWFADSCEIEIALGDAADAGGQNPRLVDRPPSSHWFWRRS